MLALAEMLREQYYITFLVRDPAPAVKDQLDEIADAIISLPGTLDYEEEADFIVQEYLTGHEILVLDGYHFTSSYQQVLKNKGNLLVYVDDLHKFFIPADLVINHTHGIEEDDYKTASYTFLCLGPSFALLRGAFLNAQPGNLNKQNKKSVFICFGGADPQNLTLKSLHASLAVSLVEEINLVIGSSYVHVSSLKLAIQTNKKINLYQNIGAQKVADVIAESTLAICPASTVAYEVCAVGCGLVTGYYILNQHKLALFMGNCGLGENMGDLSLVTTEELSKKIEENIDQNLMVGQRERQKEFFDGQQAKRFRKVFDKLSRLRQLSIRKAEERDMMLCFHWANDPFIRQQAIQQSNISLVHHQHWFLRKISSSQTYYYILFEEETPVGQVRFEYEGACYLISYALDEAFRRKGYGVPVMHKAIQQLAGETSPAVPLCAWVKVKNEASLKVFRNLNFQEAEIQYIEKEGYQVFTKNIK